MGHKSTRLFSLVLSFCLMSGLHGCALFGERLIEPEMQLADVRFGDVTVFETGVVFTVRIDNENSFPLVIDGGTHRFFLNDMYVGKGFTREPIEIEPLSSSTEEIKVHLSNLSLFSRIAGLVEQNRFEYRLESDLYVNRGFLRRKVQVEKEGSLVLPAGARRPSS